MRNKSGGEQFKAEESCDSVMGLPWLSMASAILSSTAHLITAASANPNTYLYIWIFASSSSSSFFHEDSFDVISIDVILSLT